MLLDGRTDEVGEDPLTKRRHARADLVLSAVLAVIAVVYAIETLGLPRTSPNQADIGPRAYPLLILVLLVLTTALLVLKSVRDFSVSARKAGSERKSRTERHAMLAQIVGLIIVVASTVVYLELMIPLGFIVSTTLFLALQVAMIGGWRRYGGRRMLIPMVFACITSVAIYVLFADSLGVLLPRGIFSL